MPEAATGTAFARTSAAVRQQLQGVSPHIFGDRSRVVPQQMATAIAVHLQAARREPSAGINAWSLWQTSVTVECYARPRTGKDAETALDELLGAAIAALEADRTLGGVVSDLQLGALDWDFDADGEKTACATATFAVRHRTGFTNLN